MKTVELAIRFVCVLPVLLLPLRVCAKEVTITWDLPSAGSQVAGYRVYLATDQQSLTSIDIGPTNAYTFPNLNTDSRSLIFVTAYDANGIESDASAVIEYPGESACLYVNTPARADVSELRTTDSFLITTRSDCPIDIQTDVPWIKITSVAQAGGQVRVSYVVHSNQAQSSRSGTIKTGLGPDFPITQSAGSPAVPLILNQFRTDIVADEDGDFVLSTEIEDGTQATFEWLKNGQPIAGAAQESLQVSGVTAQDAGEYSVRISDAAGTVDGPPITVQVYEKPRFFPGQEPKTTLVALGRFAYLAGLVSGSDLHFYWTKDGVSLTNDTGLIVFQAVTQADLGAYQLSVSNRLGVVQSGVAYLTTPESERQLGRINALLLPNSQLLVQAQGVPGLFYDIQVSSDLIHWSYVDSAIVDENGAFTIEAPAIPENGPADHWFVRTVRRPAAARVE